MLRTFFLVLFCIVVQSASAQSADLQQRIKGFQAEQSSEYNVKLLNLQGENLGALEQEEAAYRLHFKLE